MNGSEKQIKWAQEIKASMAMSEERLAAALEFLPEGQMAKLMAALDSGKLGDCPIAVLVEKWNAIAEQKAEASWWIEHRRMADIGGRMLARTAESIITEEMVEAL